MSTRGSFSACPRPLGVARLALVAGLALAGQAAVSGCTVAAPSVVAADGAVVWPDAAVEAGRDALALDAPDAARTAEERFASGCVRWHYWTQGESAACEECRSSSCAGLAIRAELRSRECPGEFECVQDTCYPDGTASSLACDCVLPCFTVALCRDLWIDAMECVVENCAEACGERPPD